MYSYIYLYIDILDILDILDIYRYIQIYLDILDIYVNLAEEIIATQATGT